MFSDRRRAAPKVPRLTAESQLLRRRSIQPSRAFVPPPAPTGPYPYRRALADVVGDAELERIRASGRLSFHCLGDSGGWVEPAPQRHVAAALVAERRAEDPPSFLYHLGDVVYPHGEEGHYGSQFFAPYADYDAPIFAIPGNHDGEAGHPAAHSLSPFLRTFCGSATALRDAAFTVPRPPSRQPHVYWTLTHEWLWIIGMYSNVHEDGEVGEDQLEWLVHELREAPREAVVVLAVHRPVYSADVVHGSNLALGDALDDCFTAADRRPDLVLSGHAHNYQRYSRAIEDHRVPYLVVGAGGFHERHRLGSGINTLPERFASLPGVSLEAYDDDAQGFLTVTVQPDGSCHGEYRIVDEATELRDRWELSRRR